MYSKITHAKIVTPEKIIEGTISFENGVITSIEESFSNDANAFDAQGNYVLPGLIETHGHFREPGFEQKEDITHGTQAALAGGFTTVFDMPNTKPPITTVARLHEQINRYREKSFCDFAINFGAEVGENYLEELKNIDPTEVTGVKVFMAGHQTTPTTVTQKEDQAKIWELAAQKKLPILAHAEDQELVTKQESHMQSAGRTDMLAYSQARNEEVVEKAAWDAINLGIKYNTKIWILHASTAGEFSAITFGRNHGIVAGGEVTGYQLFFTTDDYEKLGTLIKVSPALRSPKVNKELWQMVRDGVIDGFCSEHTPHTLAEKNTDVWNAVSGTPNIQESVPAFITGWIREFGEKTIDEGLHRLALMSSTHIADFFGFPQKSGIKIGNDADFTIINSSKKWKVVKEDLFTKQKWSAYEGYTLIGSPDATFLRGELMYQNGKIVNQRKGVWLKKK